MRRAAHESWRLTVDASKLLHLPLYVRDVLGLRVSRDGLPPRLLELDGSIDVRRANLVDKRRRDLEEEWLHWWHLAIRHENSLATLAARRVSPESKEWRQKFSGTLRGAAELDGPLGVVAREHQGVADDWLHDMLCGGDRALSAADWSVMDIARDNRWLGAIAREVVQQRSAAISEAQVRVNILFVEGRWWQCPAPGLLLCSSAVIADRQAMRKLLRERFDSSLAR